MKTHHDFLYFGRNLYWLAVHFYFLNRIGRQPLIYFSSKDLSVLGISYKWNHIIIHGHLWLASFPEHIYFQDLSMLQQAKYFILWPKNKYPIEQQYHALVIHSSLDGCLICLIFFGCYEWCYYEHSPIKFWANIGFPFSWLYI